MRGEYAALVIAGSAVVGAEIESNVELPIPSSGNKYIDAGIEAVIGGIGAFAAAHIPHEEASMVGVGIGAGFAFSAVVNAIF